VHTLFGTLNRDTKRHCADDGRCVVFRLGVGFGVQVGLINEYHAVVRDDSSLQRREGKFTSAIVHGHAAAAPQIKILPVRWGDGAVTTGSPPSGAKLISQRAQAGALDRDSHSRLKYDR